MPFYHSALVRTTKYPETSQCRDLGEVDANRYLEFNIYIRMLRRVTQALGIVGCAAVLFRQHLFGRQSADLSGGNGWISVLRCEFFTNGNLVNWRIEGRGPASRWLRGSKETDTMKYLIQLNPEAQVLYHRINLYHD